MIKIAIVDDHKMFRDGISHILNSSEGYQVLWTAQDKNEVLQSLPKAIPDVLIMDISLGDENGLDITHELLLQNNTLKVLALSRHQEDEYIIKMIETGAKGYLLKDSGIEELKKAILKINNGGFYCDDSIMQTVILNMSKPKDTSHRTLSENANNLTKRELEILQLIAKEYSNGEISKMLFISSRTVESHKRNMISKLKVKNSIGLVRYALENGILDKNSSADLN